MQPLATDDPLVIGPYRLLGRLGAGGMGRVFLGRSPGGRTVAVKVVRAELAGDTEFRTRFRREVDAARRIGGAWSAPVLDADTESPVPWIATGYVAGPALSDAVSEFGPLPDSGVRALGAGLAEALTCVHGLGLIHRDLKPSNVLLALDGPVLIDFGIARAMDGSASVTGSGVVVGSPGYMSPEQVLTRPLGPACDVFALGAVLAFAATGHGPFRGDSAAVLLYKVAPEDPELHGMTGELREVAQACLAKNPAARPTPRQIAARLAPEGAVTLIRRGGWLPAPLVAQLSRRVIELLDLELAPTAAYGARTADGARAAYGWGGGYGPPPVMSAEPPHAEPVDDAGPVPAPVARGRGRRRRTVLVLTLIGALIAGGVTVFLLTRPHSGASGTEDSRTGGTSAAPGTVPDAFIGTWQGTVHTDAGLSNGEVTVTVTRGTIGSDVAQATYSFLTFQCHSKSKLTAVAGDDLTLAARSADATPSALCTGAAATEHLTLNPDGTLQYRSDDARGGNPTAKLSRRDG